MNKEGIACTYGKEGPANAHQSEEAPQPPAVNRASEDGYVTLHPTDEADWDEDVVGLNDNPVEERDDPNPEVVGCIDDNPAEERGDPDPEVVWSIGDIFTGFEFQIPTAPDGTYWIPWERQGCYMLVIEESENETRSTYGQRRFMVDRHDEKAKGTGKGQERAMASDALAMYAIQDAPPPQESPQWEQYGK